MIVSLKKEFRFEASHQLPNHDGKCARLHGHSWRLVVEIEGDVKNEPDSPKDGMVMDYTDMKAIVQPIIEMLDHHHLGSGHVSDNWGNSFILESDVDNIPSFFVPTSENLLGWIARQLPYDFPWASLSLNETCTSEAILYRKNLLGEPPFDAA